MKKITLLQEPGFLWDLYYIFYLKFNQEDLFKLTSANEKNKMLSQHYAEIFNRFCDFSDDLFVFFHTVWHHDSTFIYTYYLKRYEQFFLKQYNVEFLQQEFADSHQVVRNMISFYFCEIKKDDLENYINSKEALFDYIKMSNYSMEEKIKLYEFFINPLYYINLFQRTLIDKCSELSGYYKEHYKKIINTYDLSSLYKLSDRYMIDKDGKGMTEGYVSYCMLDRVRLDVISNAETYLYLLGIDYESMLNDDKTVVEESVLENFCYALCEKNRINILSLLLERGELTCKDLERFFDFSGSTAYHHLSIMTRLGILSTRSKGKTMFYSINKRMFNDVITRLKQFAN